MILAWRISVLEDCRETGYPSEESNWNTETSTNKCGGGRIDIDYLCPICLHRQNQVFTRILGIYHELILKQNVTEADYHVSINCDWGYGSPNSYSVSDSEYNLMSLLGNQKLHV